jgi:hypothetical protein
VGSSCRLALVLGTAFALAIAGPVSAEEPTIVEVGGQLPIISGGFSPKALPKKGEPAPLAMNIAGNVYAPAGKRPPGFREVDLELDRNVTVDAEGLTVCSTRTIEGPPLPQRCGGALVGSGTVEVEVEFPEQAPFALKAKLLAFNHGIKRGQTTILGYSYLGVPVSAAMVSNIAITKVHDGRYGTRWVLAFPKIAGGYGSITSFELTVNRRYHYEGEGRSYLLGRCPDGHLNAQATSVLSDSSEQPNAFVRSCVPKD